MPTRREENCQGPPRVFDKPRSLAVPILVRPFLEGVGRESNWKATTLEVFLCLKALICWQLAQRVASRHSTCSPREGYIVSRFWDTARST